MENIEWYMYPLIVIAGFGAGFINTLAGSGSLITISLMLFMGIPAHLANGTNRVGVLFQTLTSTLSFRQEKALDMRGGLILSIPASIGSILGAQIAVDLNETVLDRTIGVLMLAMLVVILVRPNRWLQGRTEEIQEKPGIKQILVMFIIGIYGGFIQAGVGIFLLAGLVLSVGYGLVSANAVKTLIVLVFTAFALAVFIINDQVLWGIGLLLALGNALGGWAAAKMAVKQGAGFVRWLLIIVVFIAAMRQLGVFDLIGGLFV